MPNSKLANKLATGLAADIFYDANDYGDKAADAEIEIFQAAVTQVVSELDIIANLDLSGENLSARDIKLLREMQTRIQ
jgi:hypothetical protein